MAVEARTAGLVTVQWGAMVALVALAVAVTGPQLQGLIAGQMGAYINSDEMRLPVKATKTVCKDAPAGRVCVATHLG